MCCSIRYSQVLISVGILSETGGALFGYGKVVFIIALIFFFYDKHV